MAHTISEIREWLRTHGHPDHYKLSDQEARSLFYILQLKEEGLYECSTTL